MGRKTMIALIILSVFFVGFASADLVFKENFEADKLDENQWGNVGAGVGGPNSFISFL